MQLKIGPSWNLFIWLGYRDIEGSSGFQRVPEGADRTVGMAMISGINKLGPQKVKVQVS